MLAFISVPFAPLLLPRLIMSQTCFFEIHVYPVMRDAGLVLLSYHLLKHSRSESVSAIGFLDDLSLLFDVRLSGSPNVPSENRLAARFLKVFPDLLNPPPRDLHVTGNLFCSNSLLLLTNDPVNFSPVQLHIP